MKSHFEGFKNNLTLFFCNSYFQREFICFISKPVPPRYKIQKLRLKTSFKKERENNMKIVLKFMTIILYILRLVSFFINYSMFLLLCFFFIYKHFRQGGYMYTRKKNNFCFLKKIVCDINITLMGLGIK